MSAKRVCQFFVACFGELKWLETNNKKHNWFDTFIVWALRVCPALPIVRCYPALPYTPTFVQPSSLATSHPKQVCIMYVPNGRRYIDTHLSLHQNIRIRGPCAHRVLLFCLHVVGVWQRWSRPARHHGRDKARNLQNCNLQRSIPPKSGLGIKKFTISKIISSKAHNLQNRNIQ